MLILGIETSCDETAAAMVENGTCILSSLVASQVEVHHPYGGVVPELASRAHLENIAPVVEAAIRDSGKTPDEIQAVAATQGPGLVGCLLVGFTFAKGFSLALGLPFIGVNHLNSHVNAVFLAPDPPPFPFIALLASGGHTMILHVRSHTEMELMGQTRDDAAGEAFDKVSKALGLGYPGGEIIGKIAENGKPDKIKFPRAWLDKDRFDFSFSGLKTSVKRYIETHQDTYEDEIADIVAGFQEAAVDVLVGKAVAAAKKTDCKHLAVVGGVAANSRLREAAREKAGASGITVHIPPLALCGDNAAMIAATGFHVLKNGRTTGLDEDVFSRIKRA